MNSKTWQNLQLSRLKSGTDSSLSWNRPLLIKQEEWNSHTRVIKNKLFIHSVNSLLLRNKSTSGPFPLPDNNGFRSISLLHLIQVTPATVWPLRIWSDRSMKLVLVLHCNYTSTLKNCTWHASVLSTSPMWSASHNTCNRLLCNKRASDVDVLPSVKFLAPLS